MNHQQSKIVLVEGDDRGNDSLLSHVVYPRCNGYLRAAQGDAYEEHLIVSESSCFPCFRVSVDAPRLVIQHPDQLSTSSMPYRSTIVPT